MKVVLYTGSWCHTCHDVMPFAERLEEVIKVEYIDVEANPELAVARKVVVLPTMLLIDGGATVERWEGVINEHLVRTVIDSYLEDK